MQIKQFSCLTACHASLDPSKYTMSHVIISLVRLPFFEQRAHSLAHFSTKNQKLSKHHPSTSCIYRKRLLLLRRRCFPSRTLGGREGLGSCGALLLRLLGARSMVEGETRFVESRSVFIFCPVVIVFMNELYSHHSSCRGFHLRSSYRFSRRSRILRTIRIDSLRLLRTI